MKTLETPTGYRVETRPNGLYLIDADLVRALERASGSANIMISQNAASSYFVEIDHGELPPFSIGVAEWGSGVTLEDALRYALGAHFGSYDDPVVGTLIHGDGGRCPDPDNCDDPNGEII